MILSRMIFPPVREPEKRALYVRGKAESAPDGGLMLPAGTEVRFDTYFNAFFYGAYLRHTFAERIRLCLLTSGDLQAALVTADQDGNETVLLRTEISGQQEQTAFPEYELSRLPECGALFLVCRGISSSAVLHAGWYESPLTPSAVKVAAVICTYRREREIYQNLQVLEKAIFSDSDCPARKNLDVLVVDNGRSLRLEEMRLEGMPQVCVFPNKNCGGSGGFARGMLEACREPGRYTHILLMDDDISFEPETLVRTIQFLKAARPAERPLCIGGQMLLEHKPVIQFESGSGYRNGRLSPSGKGLDLSRRECLLENARPAAVQYNAWWYCCFPVPAVQKYGLPMPFFIKTDDVEYGLRLRPEIVLLNGIGVWHTAFSEKYSPHLEYYIKRNELVVSAIYGSGAGRLSSCRKLIRGYGRAVLTGDTRAVPFLLAAARDFLQGPEFFLRTDAEAWNRRLKEILTHPVEGRLRSLLAAPYRLLPVLISLCLRYPQVRREYQMRQTELTAPDFWRRQLNIH